MTPRSSVKAAAVVITALVVAAFGGCGLPVTGPDGPAPGDTCATDAQCNDSNPCTIDACGADALCVITSAPDGVAPEQAAGDCKTNLCAAGVLSTENTNEDVENDSNQCTDDTCQNGVPQHFALGGEPCLLGGQQGTCTMQGVCDVVCTEDADCDDMEACTIDTCNVGAGTCSSSPLDGDLVPGAAQPSGDCRIRVCVRGVDFEAQLGGAVDDSDVPPEISGNCRTATCVDGTPSFDVTDSDLPDDNNDCTNDSCSAGSVVHASKGDGAPCLGSFFCNSQDQCVGCTTASQCGVNDDCKTFTCVNETCGVANAGVGTPVGASPPPGFGGQVVGDCKTLICDGAGSATTEENVADHVDDGNECTNDICVNSMPAHPAKPAGTACGPALAQVCTGMGPPVAACVQCIDNTKCTAPQTCGGGGVPNVCGCTDSGIA
jgi:hypothetical protein